jgi:hypothetical protein
MLREELSQNAGLLWSFMHAVFTTARLRSALRSCLVYILRGFLPTPSSISEGLSLVGFPRSLIQDIPKYPPHLETFWSSHIVTTNGINLITAIQ